MTVRRTKSSVEYPELVLVEDGRAKEGNDKKCWKIFMSILISILLRDLWSGLVSNICCITLHFKPHLPRELFKPELK